MPSPLAPHTLLPPLFTVLDTSQLTTSPVAAPLSNGIWLAWIILAGMILVLILSVAAILRALGDKPLPEPKGWLDWAFPVLSVIGLSVAVYLNFIESTSARAICGPIGDCNAVQSSPYAKLFGVLPVGLLGAIGYLGILIVWLYRRLRKDRLAQLAGPALFGMAAFATLFSIYLTYLEIFVIRAVCLWCLSSAVISALLMLLSLGPVTQWLAVTEEE